MEKTLLNLFHIAFTKTYIQEFLWNLLHWNIENIVMEMEIKCSDLKEHEMSFRF